MKRIFCKRVEIILIFFIFGFCILTTKIALIQIVNGEELKRQAIQIQNRYLVIEEFPRGNIADELGRSLLDEQYMAREVYVADDRKVLIIEDRSEVVQTIDIDTNTTSSYPVQIIQRYGANSLARHLIGHLTAGVGVNGLESIYETYLKSTPKYLWKIVLDARGNIVPGLSFQMEERGDVERNTLILTINKDVQEIVEKAMDQSIISGAAVVMNPANGDIIALASRPNFNQNDVISSTNNLDVNYVNKSFKHYYPGSLFKILIAAAAIEEELALTHEKFICNGFYEFNTGLKINCWFKEGHGELSLVEAMAHSCNPVFINLGLRLGRQNLLKYSERVGLTENLVLGYPQNIIDKIQIDFGPGKIANASLGQEGIMITPVQVAVLLSSIANGGYVVTPRVVKEIVGHSGKIVHAVAAVPPYRIWSQNTAKEVKEMLFAVNKWGTGHNAWTTNAPSAGKTASAQSGNNINAWYAGFYPIDKPQYVVVILVEKGKSGGQDAAPVFKRIIEELNQTH